MPEYEEARRLAEDALKWEARGVFYSRFVYPLAQQVLELLALATALSECREREDDWRKALEQQTMRGRKVCPYCEGRPAGLGHHTGCPLWNGAPPAQPPSEASEEERCTTCGATPETGINSDCPECYGITRPSEASERKDDDPA